MTDLHAQAKLRTLGSMNTRWKVDRVTPCTYVVDGERVAARRGALAEWAIVECAAGYHARVRFESDGVTAWRCVGDLARPRSA